MPGAVGTKSPDVAAPADRGVVDVNTSSVHAASLNRRKVTVPVGTWPPTRLAVPRTGVPTGPPGDAAARISGDCLPTVMVKVWQACGAAPLLAQTVVGP